VLITKNNHIKIADFGISKYFEDSQLELAHTLVGTTDYMSPEVLKGRYDYKSDVWSVGCVIFELITLKKLKFFINATFTQEIEDILATKIPVHLEKILKM
jgi:serine/threonine protein kinase